MTVATERIPYTRAWLAYCIGHELAARRAEWLKAQGEGEVPRG